MAQNGPSMTQNDPKWPKNDPKWPTITPKWPKNEQELCEPISLSLERALSSEIGSQDPCSARSAAPALQHFMLLWLTTMPWTLLQRQEDKVLETKSLEV